MHACMVTWGILERRVNWNSSFSRRFVYLEFLFFLHTFISLRETYFTKTMYIRGDQRWRLGEEILLLFIITFHSVEKWSRKRVLTD